MKAVIVASFATREDVRSASAALEASSVGEETSLVLDVGVGGASAAALRDSGVSALVALAAERNAAVIVAAAAGVSLPLALDRASRHDRVLDALRQLLPPQSHGFHARITVPARVEYLPALRQVLAEAVIAQHGEAEAFQVEILVDELCLNAAENSRSWTDTYDIVAVCEGHELQVEVTNTFDAGAEPEQTMNGRLQSFDDSGGYLGERGRGLFLIARIADGLQIRQLPGDRVRVVATKRLRGEPSAPGALAGGGAAPA